MDKLYIRKIVAVWAFDNDNQAVWKCSEVDKLKLSQDGERVKKKDSSGSVMYQFDRAKSAKLSFDAVVWGVDLISALSGTAKSEADEYNPINVPYTQSWILTDEDVAKGSLLLEHQPSNKMELSLHKLSKENSVESAYRYNDITSTEGMFSYDAKTNSVLLPTNVKVGDTIEIIYEYQAFRATKIINNAFAFPPSWKVKILALASKPCNTDKIFAVWITANNAKTTLNNDFNFELEETLNITLELGYKFCDNKKNLYEIVLVDGDEQEEPPTHEYFTLDISVLDGEDTIL